MYVMGARLVMWCHECCRWISGYHRIWCQDLGSRFEWFKFKIISFAKRDFKLKSQNAKVINNPEFESNDFKFWLNTANFKISRWVTFWRMKLFFSVQPCLEIEYQSNKTVARNIKPWSHEDDAWNHWNYTILRACFFRFVLISVLILGQPFDDVESTRVYNLLCTPLKSASTAAMWLRCEINIRPRFGWNLGSRTQ